MNDVRVSRNFSSLKLKDDHALRPLWVCPLEDSEGSLDKVARIFLETFSPFYGPAYDFLIAIAEPICRPELIHEYKITAYSLYAAVSVGLRTEDIVKGLNRLSKNELDEEFMHWLKDKTQKCGKLKLVLKKQRYFLESTEEEILFALLKDETIYSARIKSDDMTYNENGLIVERFVHTNRGEYAGMNNNKVDAKEKEKDAKDSNNSKNSTNNSKDAKNANNNNNNASQGARMQSARIESSNRSYNANNSNNNNNNNNSSNNANNANNGVETPLFEQSLEPRVEDIVSFEIDPSQIEIVKQCCQTLGFPCVEEYDFRGDKQSASINMTLKPIAKHRPYQEKSLSKMFGNGRARSGIIVLPCGAGKTLTGITAVATVKKSCIIFCNTTVSVHQWFHQILHWAHIDRRRVLEFSSQKKDKIPTNSNDPVILVTTYYMFGNSGRKRSKATQAVMDAIEAREWGLLVLDEVHIAPAKTFRQVTTQVKSRTKLGLTATLLREDAKIEDLYYLIGPKLYEANWLDLQKAGYLAKVQCVEVWAEMTHEFYHHYLKTRNGKNKRAAQLLSDFNPNKFRSMEYLINVHTARGDKVLVFSDNIELLKHCAITLKHPQIYGETKDVERKYWLHRFNHTNSVNCLFISSVGDTSIDLPDVNVVVQISSHYGSRRQEAQRLGRILRPKPRQGDEFNAFFYTIVSKDTVDMLYATKRQRFLVDQGYSFHVITDLISGPQADQLHYGDESEQQELLQKVLTIMAGKHNIKEAKYANEERYAKDDHVYNSLDEGSDSEVPDDDVADANKGKGARGARGSRGGRGGGRGGNRSSGLASRVKTNMGKISGAAGTYSEFGGQTTQSSGSRSRGGGRSGNSSGSGRGRGRGKVTGKKRGPQSDFFKKEAKKKKTLKDRMRTLLPK